MCPLLPPSAVSYFGMKVATSPCVSAISRTPALNRTA
jgi:hypothetical protein